MTSPPDIGLQALEEASDQIDVVASSGRLQEAVERRSELMHTLQHLGPAARPLQAANLFKQAVTLQRMGKAEASLALLHEVSEGFADVSVPGKHSIAADAQYLLCRYNFKAGRYDAAVTAADEFVSKYGTDCEFADRVGDALVTKSRCFLPHRLDRPELALAALDAVIDQFGASVKPTVRKQVALAMYDKGAILRNGGRPEEAISLWDAIFRQFKADLSGEALPFLAQAAKIDLLLDTKQTRAAREGAQRLAECLETPGQSNSLLREIARNTLRAGSAMERAGMITEARELFTAVATRLLTEEDSDLQTLGVYAQIDAGVMLKRLGELSEASLATKAVVAVGEPALVALNEIIDRARTSGAGISTQREPWALLMKGLVLDHLGRRSEARMCFLEVVDRFSQDASSVVQLLVATASDACSAISTDGIG